MAKAAAREGAEATDAGTAAPAAAEVADVTMAEGTDDEGLQAALAMSMGQEEAPQFAGPGLPENFRGNYELVSMVTHKGRTADSGHYMGWTKVSDTDWNCFDDDDVQACKSEHILE